LRLEIYRSLKKVDINPFRAGFYLKKSSSVSTFLWLKVMNNLLPLIDDRWQDIFISLILSDNK